MMGLEKPRRSRKLRLRDLKTTIFTIQSLHARKVFANFFTEITRVSRLSSRFARDNFLKFTKTFLGLLNACKN